MRRSCLDAVSRCCGRPLLALVVLSAMLVAATATAQAQTTRVSQRADGTPANGGSSQAVISGNGRYVAFCSTASNLVPGDTNGVMDVFVRDLETTAIERVSVASDGAQANGASCFFGGALSSASPASVAITPDGRYVAFSSIASNLAPGVDTNDVNDIFVHDRVTRDTARVSVADDGRQIFDWNYGHVGSLYPRISADGRYVLFRSPLNSDIDADGNDAPFLRDRILNHTIRLASDDPVTHEDAPFALGMDATARFILLLMGGGKGPLVMLDRTTNGLEIIDEDPGGVVTNLPRSACLSADGRYVAFVSASGPPQVYVRDRAARTTVRLRLVVNGAEPAGQLTVGSISDDGRYVAFALGATNVQQVYPGPGGVFVHDSRTHDTVRVDVSSAGVAGNTPGCCPSDNPGSWLPGLSAAGRWAIFASVSTNLVEAGDDTVLKLHVYARDLSDTDNDGLPDDWERQFGVDTARATGADGPDGDPDNDGLTNRQELIAGTHPRGLSPSYLAEGATGSFFFTRLVVLNPGTTTAHLLLRFLKSDGTSVSQYLALPPRSRQHIDAASVPGLEGAEFATIADSDEPIVLDRTMWWDPARGYGTHAETATASPLRTWFFAEGATHSGFSLFYLIQNPGTSEATVTVSYLLPSGTPLVKQYTVPAQARFNLWVNDEAARDPVLAPLRSTDVAVTMTSDRPILVERSMYLEAAGTMFAAGHDAMGAGSLSLTWFFGEGATGAFFDSFVLLANPGQQDSDVEATYLLPTGERVIKTYRVAGERRLTIWVDREDPRLADTAVSVQLRSTNGVPVVAERAMWWPGPSATTWAEAHVSCGATATGTRWAMAEGEVMTSAPFTQTYVLVANTSSTAGQARVTLIFEDGSAEIVRFFDLAPTSRFNVDVGAEFPAARGKTFGVLVESLGGAPVQLVVEASMYSDVGATRWAAGTNRLASRLQ